MRMPVEEALTRQFRPLVDQDLTVAFYDLTTVRIHGEGKAEADIRAYGMNKETGGVARQFVLSVVQSADGLPLMHTAHPGNVSETKTLQGMLQKVLVRFPVQRIILVADCGLLSLENIGELSELAGRGDRKLEFILAVPARRYADLTETFESLAFDEAGLAESTFSGHRLIVAHDPVRAKEQTDPSPRPYQGIGRPGGKNSCQARRSGQREGPLAEGAPLIAGPIADLPGPSPKRN